MQALFSVFSDVGKYLRPEPLKIGYSFDKEYIPKIVITGEKTDHYVVEALNNYTNQNPRWVSLTNLDVESKRYDLNKDLLILIIHKSPGNCPIRGFSTFDGPLSAYQAPIFKFKKRVAVIILHSSENRSIADVQCQADKQLPENLKNRVLVTDKFLNNLSNIAKQIQAIVDDSIFKKLL